MDSAGKKKTRSDRVRTTVPVPSVPAAGPESRILLPRGDGLVPGPGRVPGTHLHPRPAGAPPRSRGRQLRKVPGAAGGRVAPSPRISEDVKSGGLDLDNAGTGTGTTSSDDYGIPRDGGLAAQLTEAEDKDTEVRGRGDVRGHRPVRPRHLQRPPASKRNCPAPGSCSSRRTSPSTSPAPPPPPLLVRRMKHSVAEWSGST